MPESLTLVASSSARRLPYGSGPADWTTFERTTSLDRSNHGSTLCVAPRRVESVAVKEVQNTHKAICAALATAALAPADQPVAGRCDIQARSRAHGPRNPSLDNWRHGGHHPPALHSWEHDSCADLEVSSHGRQEALSSSVTCGSDPAPCGCLARSNDACDTLSGPREYEVVGSSASSASFHSSMSDSEPGMPSDILPTLTDSASLRTSLRALSCSTSIPQGSGTVGTLAAAVAAISSTEHLPIPEPAALTLQRPPLAPLQPPPLAPLSCGPPAALPYGELRKGTWEPLNMLTLACPDRLAADRDAWCMADFEHVRKAGSGESSTVHVMKERLTRWQLVVKVCRRADMRPGDDARIRQEVRLHAALSHPHICPLYGAFETPAGDIALVLRYASLGNVVEHLAQLHGSASEPYAAARLLEPVVSALDYLHARGIVHRDVKGENVVVDGETGNAMLVDFGIAADTRSLAPQPPSVGTPPYMAPELLLMATPPAPSDDIWAIGVLTHKILIGSYPFPHASTASLLAAIQEEDVRVPRYLSVVAASFMQQALTRCPAERPSISELRRHPWLVSRGSVVPVNLEAPAWRSLGVAPPDGSGALDLLPCPQGIDQAQYDGLSRVRFKRGGLHAPNIALTGPLCLTSHCSFTRTHSPPSAVAATLAEAEQDSSTLLSSQHAGSGEDESRLLPSSRTASCMDAKPSSTAFWGMSTRNPHVRDASARAANPCGGPVRPSSDDFVPPSSSCTPPRSPCAVRPKPRTARSLLTLQLACQASLTDSLGSASSASLSAELRGVSHVEPTHLPGSLDCAGGERLPLMLGTSENVDKDGGDAAAAVTWRKLYQTACASTDQLAPVADMMRAATAEAALTTVGAPSMTSSHAATTSHVAPAGDTAAVATRRRSGRRRRGRGAVRPAGASAALLAREEEPAVAHDVAGEA